MLKKNNTNSSTAHRILILSSLFELEGIHFTVNLLPASFSNSSLDLKDSYWVQQIQW